MTPVPPDHDATAFQARRTIALTDPKPETLAQAERVLRALDWVDDVQVKRRYLHVRYDASAVNFRDIEQRLDEAGLQQPATPWWRLRAAWYRFLDTNTRSNALSRGGACCSRPPSVRHGDDDGPEARS